MSSLEHALSALRDVDGIVGSFVLTAEGALVAKDLPAIYPDAFVTEAATRIARLVQALSDGDTMPAHCTVRYSEHKLLVKASAPYLAVAVGLAGANAAQARAGLNLIARQLAQRPGLIPNPSSSSRPPKVGGEQDVPLSLDIAVEAPPPTSRSVTPPLPPKGTEPPTRRAQRTLLFRGKRVG